VWPGVTVWPDWFHPSVQAFWNNEFQIFFNPKDGIDIDGVWVDMNEPTDFCRYPCPDPYAQAAALGLPPPRNRSRQPRVFSLEYARGRAIERRLEDGEVDLLEPPYTIGNNQPFLSDKTARTDIVHENGMIEYDTRRSFQLSYK
jgi:alpha-glucosidase